MYTFGSSSEKAQPANTSQSSVKAQLQQESPSSCRQTTPRTTCRSVKSIVAWLESSSTSPQPCSPSISVADTPPSPSTGPVSTCHHQRTRPKQRAPAASDVEDYSLTFLKYQDYFASAPPLGRCLDREDDPPQSARGGLTAREAEEASGRRKRADAQGAAPMVVGRGRLDEAEKHGGQPDTTAVPGFVQRDPDEARAFWDHVRCRLAISDEELESDGAWAMTQSLL
ncbi:hypothetical protein E4U41_002792 [Claviceps citrina]|nr:hypothetical protein E4U41_002792 [Claviceps citrina]